MKRLEIVVGGQYELGRYQTYGETVRVRVTGIYQDFKGWYDDHQDGGWWERPSVEYEIVDEPGCDGVTALSYAQDTWQEVSEVQS